MRYHRFLEFCLVSAVGGVGYCALEVIWRGWSHVSMALAGALCFGLYYWFCAVSRRPLWQRALAGAGIITAVELCVGLVVNVWLGLGVWDYSSLPFNLWGQVSLLYSVLWFGLCLPIAGVCRFLRRQVFGWQDEPVRPSAQPFRSQH
ncbi:MAG: hypothetical protein IKD37_00970 [Clostridia bacterium]|nr:hypothetical protein [Clostridia bacterium]